MNDEKFLDHLLCVVITTIIVGLFTYMVTDLSWRMSAVDRGFAHYNVSSDGKTHFKWNNPHFRLTEPQVIVK